MAYIDADKLITFANNHKNKMIDANDIARFPTADVVPKSEVEKIFEELDGITDLVAKGLIGELEFYDRIAELKKKYTESES